MRDSIMKDIETEEESKKSKKERDQEI